MKEYCIYIRHGSGTPFIVHYFNNIHSAKLKLYDIINLDEERGRPYFVDNDFFKNKYNISTKLTYYCIKEREITEFKKYSEEEYNNKHNDSIVYFLNYKK